jgi:hypothetical protein
MSTKGQTNITDNLFLNSAMQRLNFEYDKPLPRYLKNMACQGTLFAILSSYGVYLWGSRISYGILFGYALAAGYNQRYLIDFLRNKKNI